MSATPRMSYSRKIAGFMGRHLTPRTLNGKKMEVPIKRLLMGTPAERVANPGTMGNPQSLAFFLELAKSRQ